MPSARAPGPVHAAALSRRIPHGLRHARLIGRLLGLAQPPLGQIAVRAACAWTTRRNYWASVGGYPGSGYLTVGGPRMFSLSASVDF